LFNEVFDFKPTKGVTGIRLRASWGVWRNAGDVPLDYEPDQVVRAAATPSTFHVEGNVGPPSKSLPASSAEIVIAHRTQNLRLQF
jgi:hypothetical protein